MKGMATCKICGRDFALIAEENYAVRDNEKSGIAVAFGGSESTLYDAFDCPHCGCQNIMQERKRVYNPFKDHNFMDVPEIENNDEEKEEEAE